MSGLTAYFGLKHIGKLKQGETVVVSTAAGAVGEIAVQLAKNAGCVVCGIAGSDEKCQYVKSLGADYVINYKKDSVKSKLKEYCPKGVNVYFDNVGGEMLDEVLMHIRDESRIIACGAISTYGDLNSSKQESYKIKNYSRIIIKRAVIQGFLYFDYVKEFPEAIAELSKLRTEGKLKSKFDMRHGVEECSKSLVDLLQGKNTGKIVVKVDNTMTVKPSL